MLNALIILDGFGISKDTKGNAIYKSGTPFFKQLWDKYPHTQIGASGLDVGLPDGQMGNSEVGHINMGAGRIVYQELTRISKEIADGVFFENPALNAAIENAQKPGRALHVMGLLSDGGVHSHIEHLFALIKMAKDKGLSDVYIHCFLDGRDVSPTSGVGYVIQLQKYLDELKFGKIASIMGRYYAMDRDNRWDRVEKAYTALVDGIGT
ncbi:MAG: 2,3-bisphosphoglycerate-independent phosphoglycerate mutase, partial [Christensenellaceae bacterium]|nr:2,3-bisphosphoglycerate-independent phosphoglycerate mutase [Christensenellaceae bacterium]